MTKEVKPVVCTGCAQQCGLLAEVVNGRVTRLTGDRLHPVSRGFICPKGAGAAGLHYDPTRIHTPLKRAGPRGGGAWQEIAWDQALDEIADAVRRLTDAHGRESLAYSFGTLHAADVGLGERFMNLFGSPNTVGQDKVCYGPNAVGEALTYGWGPTMYTPPVPGKTRCDLLWGFRPSASMPLLWGAITAARRAGAKLIVVDPQRTHEAALADLFLQIRPGSDVILALSMIDVIVREGLYDRDFVAQRTEGFDELAARAREYPPARAEELTWLPARQIEAGARMLATNSPAIVHGSNGLCQGGATAVQAGRALACLIAITGNLDAPGGHALPGPPQYIVANGDAVLCDMLTAEQRAKRLGAELYPMIGDGYSHLGEAMAGAWYGQRHSLSWCASAHEPSLWRSILTEEPYPVKALIIQCHNAVGSGANARLTADALTSDNLELLVVHDLFMNRTSMLADYLLPAAHWLEKPFYSTAYGYQGFAGDYVEAESAAVPASHPSDYDLWRDLGCRLDQRAQWPDTVEEYWDGLLAPAGLTYAATRDHRGPLVGDAARGGRAAVPREPRYGTPSGKVELRSSLLDRWGLDPLPVSHPPGVFRGQESQYPLVLITGGRDLSGFHQNAQQMAAFRSRYSDPLASLHPHAAAATGIREGDWIRIATPIGEIVHRARITDTIAARVVHADRWWYPELAADPVDPFGFWLTNINVCTDDRTESCDPVMGSWLLRALPCRISTVDEDTGSRLTARLRRSRDSSVPAATPETF